MNRNLVTVIVALLMIFLAHPCPGAAATPSRVWLRDDNTIMVGRQPFFPIGLYYCAEELTDPTGRQLTELRKMGFNTLGFYLYGQPGWQDALDRAHRLGFKVWVRGVNGFAVDSPQVEQACRDQIHALRSHPALLLWEFQDEPLLNKVSVAASRTGQELLRREDPNHPILTIEWPRAVARIAEWNGLGDLYGFDLYPIPRERKYGALPDHDITQVADYCAAIRRARGNSAILMVLQAWSWDPLQYGQHGYPTPAESRFMAYQAVIHGAKGLHYYGQVHCTKPNSAAALWSQAKDPAIQQAEFEKCLELNRWFWDQHRPFFQELVQAARIFVLRDAPAARQVKLAQASGTPTLSVKQDAADGLQRLRLEFPSVETRTKTNGRDLYLLAVNANADPRAADFALPPGVTAKRLHVLFENRSIPVAEGRFRDSFAPYGVHVYATTPNLP
ncbi:hypothetical protein HQ590_08195 [bacterium]|nr:hypothetical protein [bacterium]